jgi:hypothetical protein
VGKVVALALMFPVMGNGVTATSQLAYRNIKRNDGSVTAGTDKLTMRDIEKCTPDELVNSGRED